MDTFNVAIAIEFLRRKSRELPADVTVKVGDVPFVLHRFILVLHSSYFGEQVIRGDLRIGSTLDLPVPINPDTFQKLVAFMYDNDLALNPDNIFEIYSVAFALGMPILIRECRHYIGVNPAIAFDLLRTGTQHHKPDVTKDAITNLAAKFPDVINSDQFLNLAPGDLCFLLGSDHLAVNSENEIYCAALNWLFHDWSDRKGYLNDVMRHVRFRLVHAYADDEVLKSHDSAMASGLPKQVLRAEFLLRFLECIATPLDGEKPKSRQGIFFCFSHRIDERKGPSNSSFGQRPSGDQENPLSIKEHVHACTKAIEIPGTVYDDIDMSIFLGMAYTCLQESAKQASEETEPSTPADRPQPCEEEKTTASSEVIAVCDGGRSERLVSLRENKADDFGPMQTQLGDDDYNGEGGDLTDDEGFDDDDDGLPSYGPESVEDETLAGTRDEEGENLTNDEGFDDDGPKPAEEEDVEHISKTEAAVHPPHSVSIKTFVFPGHQVLFVPTRNAPVLSTGTCGDEERVAQGTAEVNEDDLAKHFENLKLSEEDRTPKDTAAGNIFRVDLVCPMLDPANNRIVSLEMAIDTPPVREKSEGPLSEDPGCEEHICGTEHTSVKSEPEKGAVEKTKKREFGVLEPRRCPVHDPTPGPWWGDPRYGGMQQFTPELCMAPEFLPRRRRGWRGPRSVPLWCPWGSHFYAAESRDYMVAPQYRGHGCCDDVYCSEWTGDDVGCCCGGAAGPSGYPMDVDVEEDPIELATMPCEEADSGFEDFQGHQPQPISSTHRGSKIPKLVPRVSDCGFVENANESDDGEDSLPKKRPRRLGSPAGRSHSQRMHPSGETHTPGFKRCGCLKNVASS